MSRFNKNNKICEAKPSKKQPEVQKVLDYPALKNGASDVQRQKVFKKI